MSIEAMKQALSLICSARLCEVNSMSSRQEMLRLMIEATDTLRAAIKEEEKPWVKTYANGVPQYTTQEKQPEQEPVAWFTVDEINEWAAKYLEKHPDQEPRRWQGLTDAEIFASLKATFNDDVKLTPGFRAFARAIEAKFREKNT